MTNFANGIIPNHVRAVIFDFDGTIVDTEQIGASVCVQVCEKNLGIKLSREETSSFFGCIEPNYYATIVKKHGLKENVDNLLFHHYKIYDRIINRIRKPLPGVKSAIQTINQKGLHIGLCSNSLRQRIEHVLRNIRLHKYFDTIVAADDSLNHKPHPEPYLLASRKLNTFPKNCMVFEDSEKGIVSAKAAGMYCVGVEIGNHGTQNLEKADKVIRSFEELVK